MIINADKENLLYEESPKKNLLVGLNNILLNKVLFLIIYGIILSYFYNLPIIKYSVKGDNEFRLYDVLGVIILYNYFKYYKTVDLVIRNVPFFKILRWFMYWACITMLWSFLFHVLKNKITNFLQVVLYMYHFWVFYVAAVFFYIYCLDKKNIKIGINLILILSATNCFIVILQNLGLIDFLWNDVYKKAYLGFLSGTLGPNKIVLGMTSLFVLSLCLGLLNEKKIKSNTILLYSSIILNLYIIFISGSRTTYVGLISIILFFALKSPIKFVIIGSVLSFLFTLALSINPNLQKMLDDTLEKRIFGKTQVIDRDDVDVEVSDVGELYGDLGAGRDKLTQGNIMYLLNNPMIIPFGSGFANHLDKSHGKSAHNMYIQSIRETGIVGFFLYFGWLMSYLFIKFDKHKGFSLALQGLVFAMLVTLYFGEHLYIYRPLFGLLGLFLIITTIFVSALHKIDLKNLDQ